MAKYRTTLRPAGFGGLPHGLSWEYVELPHDSQRTDLPRSAYPYGVVSCRELTAAEIERFNLVKVEG